MRSIPDTESRRALNCLRVQVGGMSAAKYHRDAMAMALATICGYKAEEICEAYPIQKAGEH